MIALVLTGTIVALFIGGAIAGERRRTRRFYSGPDRRNSFGFISKRDLLKYK